MHTRNFTLISFYTIVLCILFSFQQKESTTEYYQNFYQNINLFEQSQIELIDIINQSDLLIDSNISTIKEKIVENRVNMKAIDFWLRYIEPTLYKKINGPLPVEWETEVFEKYEKPYRREGAGFTLALQYLDEENINKNYLLNLVNESIKATRIYKTDSISKQLTDYHHFFLCNRLFILNLAAIYTTGFDCPDAKRVIPELSSMLTSVQQIYNGFQSSFPEHALNESYLKLYKELTQFVKSQPQDYREFDHYTFVRNYVNPLYTLNQEMILHYKVVSKSLIDYSLNKKAQSIFSKNLYWGQNPKGIFLRVEDEKALAEIDALGKLLFYDPILSGNNERSCFSCHNTKMGFTDTTCSTSMGFNKQELLPRNTPSLLNVQYNHLLMLDGKHYTLQSQGKGVITSKAEMGSIETEMVEKVMNCKEYKTGFTRLLKFTPQEKKVTTEHIVSAITFYYSKFSQYYSPFDDAMNQKIQLSKEAQAGFNLFMGKAQCATCHFVPQFNGVKPPYIGSEFEVIGVPADTLYTKLSNDQGRYLMNPSPETLHAFRTGSIRNSKQSKPYMHNGVFNTLEQVINFYNAGGGVGKGLKIENQTLSSDTLGLTETEKQFLVTFIESLSENVLLEKEPTHLPHSNNSKLNLRKVGGLY